MSRRWRVRVVMIVATLAALASACSAAVSVDDAASTPDDTQTPTRTAAAEPAPTESAERSSDSQSASEPAQPTKTDGDGGDGAAETEDAETEDAATVGSNVAEAESIRDIDFLNGFTYETLLEFGPGTATVFEGYVENGEFGDDEYYWFSAGTIAYGDLDNDGVEEAVLVTTWNGGGTGYFDSVRAYRFVDGKAERAGVVGFGDRAYGGVHDVRIVDGVARVHSYTNGQGSCCPTEISESTLLLGEHTLTMAATTPALAWLALEDPRSADEVKFLPGTSSAVLTIYPSETDGSVVFEAGAGQRLELVHAGGPEPARIAVIDPTTGAPVDSPRDTQLPSDAVYELIVEFDADVSRDRSTTLELHIDRAEPADVTWTFQVDQVLLDDEPFVHTSVTWPVFSSTEPGTPTANRALADYATGLDDWWVADVTEFEDPLDDSSYDVTFDVTLSTDALVSVRFAYFDYVCCRPYPNYGQRAAVLDLRAGRLLPIEEVLDFSRIGEINAIWLDELARQDEIPTDLIVAGEDVARFDSASLTPEGVEFGTDRNSLGGGMPGTTTLVSYSLLGDLVDANLASRAQQ